MTEEEIRSLTPEQRARLEAAEREAMRVLRQALDEGRRTPRRHQLFALASLVAVTLVGLAAWGVVAVLAGR